MNFFKIFIELSIISKELEERKKNATISHEKQNEKNTKLIEDVLIIILYKKYFVLFLE